MCGESRNWYVIHILIFYSNCCDMTFDIITLTETWFNDLVSNSELFPVVRCAVVTTNFLLLVILRVTVVLIAFASNINLPVKSQYICNYK
jgi:hypothetical protein